MGTGCNTEQEYAVFNEQAKTLFEKQYGYWIEEFKKNHVDMKYTIKKISHSKTSVMLVAMVALVPEKEYRENNKYWNTFAVKLMVLKKMNTGDYKLMKIVKKDRAFENYIRGRRRLLRKQSPYKVCRENIGNLLLRLTLSLRCTNLPQYYRGKELSVFYYVALMLFLAIIMSVVRRWYPWY